VRGITLAKQAQVDCSEWRLKVRNVLQIPHLSSSQELNPGQPCRPVEVPSRGDAGMDCDEAPPLKWQLDRGKSCMPGTDSRRSQRKGETGQVKSEGKRGQRLIWSLALLLF